MTSALFPAPGEHPASTAGFDVIRHLLALIADPAAAKARLDAIETGLADLERSRDKTAAERAAFQAEQAKANAELADQRAALGRRLAEIQGAELVRAAQEERIKKHAEQVGYVAPLSFVPMAGGTGGFAVDRSIDEPRPRNDPQFDPDLPAEHYERPEHWRQHTPEPNPSPRRAKA